MKCLICSAPLVEKQLLTSSYWECSRNCVSNQLTEEVVEEMARCFAVDPAAPDADRPVLTVTDKDTGAVTFEGPVEWIKLERPYSQEYAAITKSLTDEIVVNFKMKLEGVSEEAKEILKGLTVDESVDHDKLDAFASKAPSKPFDWSDVVPQPLETMAEWKARISGYMTKAEALAANGGTYEQGKFEQHWLWDGSHVRVPPSQKAFELYEDKCDKGFSGACIGWRLKK